MRRRWCASVCAARHLVVDAGIADGSWPGTMLHRYGERLDTVAGKDAGPVPVALFVVALAGVHPCRTPYQAGKVFYGREIGR